MSAGLAGVVAGGVIGTVGAAIPLEVRLAGASLLSLMAVIVGGLEVGSRRLPLPQRDRETPQRWVHAGALRWAAVNGWVLGLGATSRIGFWLWYVVPMAALLIGDARLGAIVYGTYSLTRGAVVWPIILGPARRTDEDAVGLWLLRHTEAARRLAATQLVAVGVAVACAVGL